VSLRATMGHAMLTSFLPSRAERLRSETSPMRPCLSCAQQNASASETRPSFHVESVSFQFSKRPMQMNDGTLTGTKIAPIVVVYSVSEGKARIVFMEDDGYVR
jgi:hypothetical protein